MAELFKMAKNQFTLVLPSMNSNFNIEYGGYTLEIEVHTLV
jgi:hypothetical protein